MVAECIKDYFNFVISTDQGRDLHYQEMAYKMYYTISEQRREMDQGCGLLHVKLKPVVKLMSEKRREMDQGCGLLHLKLKPVVKLFRMGM